MRIAIGIHYNGGSYHGWQVQSDMLTVQGVVEKALAKVAAHPVRLYCAGRTDTGVHALDQVAHFDTVSQREMRSWVFGTNSYLPRDVAITWAKPVPDEFHARFSAIDRAYRYLIYNHPVRPATLASLVTWYYQALNVDKMRSACQDLIGKHDFSAYRAVGCQARSPVREIFTFDITQQNHLIQLDVRANGFLHHMVRNMVGVLMAIGSEKAPVTWAKEVLLARDRGLGGVTAPPYGLYLRRVTYDPCFRLPLPASQIVSL